MSRGPAGSVPCSPPPPRAPQRVVGAAERAAVWARHHLPLAPERQAEFLAAAHALAAADSSAPGAGPRGRLAFILLADQVMATPLLRAIAACGVQLLAPPCSTVIWALLFSLLKHAQNLGWGMA